MIYKIISKHVIKKKSGMRNKTERERERERVVYTVA